MMGMNCMATNLFSVTMNTPCIAMGDQVLYLLDESGQKILDENGNPIIIVP